MSEMCLHKWAQRATDCPLLVAGRQRTRPWRQGRPNAHQPVGFRHGYARTAICRRSPTVPGQSASGNFPGTVRLHPRRVPDRGLPGSRQRSRRTGGRADRKRQNRRGEFAIHLARATGRKAFYTTPIKALSNQKYRDLVAMYGEDEVGLLTGDVSINGHAATVVMTTEVLRNMVYEGSSDLANLGFVVLDEVHYLADRERGAVWEELIIQLPESVAIAALSATVSNVEEFGAWMATVRGDTRIVLEEHRPVPLWQQVMANAKLYDLFSGPDRQQVNPELQRLTAQGPRSKRDTRRDRPPKNGRRPRDARTPPAWRWSRNSRLRTCSRRSTSSSRAQALRTLSACWSTVGCGSPRRTSGARSPR